MKKIILTLLLSVFAISTAIAQDMESATNLYNAGAVALNEGKKADALKNFEEALNQAITIGADAEEIANNCKKVIPTLYLAIGKDYGVAKDIPNAVVFLKKAVDKGDEYGDFDTMGEASSLIPQLYMNEGNLKLNDGDFKGAIAEYKKVVEIEKDNGMAYLRMGMAASRLEDEATTVSSFQKAAEFGQKDQADKQLSQFYMKKANALMKEKKNVECMTYAKKSYELSDNATARKIYAISALGLKKYDEAIDGLEAYLSLSPDASDKNAMTLQMATSYEAKGNKEKACEYYKQVMTDPKFKDYATHKVTVDLKCN